MSKLNEMQKWIVAFLSALIFLLMSSPFMFKCTGCVFGKLGFTTQKKGCPNWIGLLIHTILFAILIRLLMLIPIPAGSKDRYDYSNNFYRGYTGLAEPGSMMRCNNAYLYAEKEKCGDCVAAAETCIHHPFTQSCVQAISRCKATCHSRDVVNAVENQCNIRGFTDYFP